MVPRRHGRRARGDSPRVRRLDGTGNPEPRELLEHYAHECRLAAAAISDLELDAKPAWWFEGGGNPPHSSLRAVLLHVIVETATHAGHLADPS